MNFDEDGPTAKVDAALGVETLAVFVCRRCGSAPVVMQEGELVTLTCANCKVKVTYGTRHS